MYIGVPKETHRHEHRVGLTPHAVKRLAGLGHKVLVEGGAGAAARFADTEYESAGATIVYSRHEVYGRADLVCRVGVVSGPELELVKPGSILLGFQHLAVSPRDTVQRLLELGVTAIGYELIEDRTGGHPILEPFSEMAGKMAVHAGAWFLQNTVGGRGALLGDVPGISPPTVVILGAGTVGRTAAQQSLAAGAHVVVLDEDMEKLRELHRVCARQVVTASAELEPLERFAGIADVLIGAVLIPGARAPLMVTEEMVRRMRPGSVILDISIDQGGCVETSRPTTPDNPTFVLHDVVHYCVPNMTASVARTASRALSRAALSVVRAVCEGSVDRVLRSDPGIAAGAVLHRGRIVRAEVAASHGIEPTPLEEVLEE